MTLTLNPTTALPLATPGSYKGGYHGLMAPWSPTLATGATDIDPNDLPS